MKTCKTLFALVLCLFSLNLFAAPVDINSATVQELSAALKGVGPTKAKLIVDYREANGPFTEATQLENVKGIGAATVTKNLDSILIELPEQPK